MSLGREVGQRGEVVSEHRRGVGEATPGELHAIARVARKPDDYSFPLFDSFCHLKPGRMRISRAY
jgi:hypothetical protein